MIRVGSIFSFLLLLLPNGKECRDVRATRMSVVDFWKNETLGDGLNVRVAHGLNSWPALVEHLHEPFLNKSMLLEGDVFLQTHRRPRHRAIPVMSSPARQADRMTFKEWLREVASLRKAIKINFRSTEVVHPVLEYLHAAQSDPLSPVLDYPLILHADVFRSPRSKEEAVDPEVFVGWTENLFPDATLSLGWTKQTNYSALDHRHKRLTWRQVFHILEYVGRLDQPVMLSIRLSVAAHSKQQLLWILGLEKSVSLLIWSDEHDQVTDWTPIFELRNSATKNRIVYDLLEKHRVILQAAHEQPIENIAPFSPSKWRAIVFSSSSADLSTVLLSERGPAFLGGPTALLMSGNAPPPYPGHQIIEGRVHFLPKRIRRDVEVDRDSGLVVYLMEKTHEIESPRVNDAIEVFIGYDGRVSIERRTKRAVNPSYEKSSVGQVVKAACYDFRVEDVGWQVTVGVTPVVCDSPPSDTPATRISLTTPLARTRMLRSVALAKRGDGDVDFLLDKLSHSGVDRMLLGWSVILTLLLLLFR